MQGSSRWAGPIELSPSLRGPGGSAADWCCPLPSICPESGLLSNSRSFPCPKRLWSSSTARELCGLYDFAPGVLTSGFRRLFFLVAPPLLTRQSVPLGWIDGTRSACPPILVFGSGNGVHSTLSLEPDIPFLHHNIRKMAESYPTLTQCAVVAAAFKVLLFPA
jgi:hypothetical protein